MPDAKPAVSSSSGGVALQSLLRCPECGRGSLSSGSASDLRCDTCSQSFPVVEGVPYLLPAKDLSGSLATEPERPKKRSQGPSAISGGAYHWREYGIEALLPPATAAPRVLLMGCGDGGERPHLRHLGYEVIGFDIKRTGGTDFVADAHRIPLQDATVDLIISMQVLEHLHSPWIAVEEAARVLRPGGWFVGSVAFLKPYHKSYFHMSHRGVAQLLAGVGLVTDTVAGAQSLTYTLYGGMLPIGGRRFKRVSLGAVDRLLLGVRAAAWSFSRGISASAPTDRFDSDFRMSFRSFDRLRSAPSVVFRARKPEN